MTDSYNLTYGEVLRELRIFHGYKQKEISDHLNITSQAYSNYENNKRTPDIETMRKIAAFYHLSLDQLISYRNTTLLQESGSYGSEKTLFRGISDEGIVIPLTAKQAKMVSDILSLNAEQQDACQNFINLIK